MSIQATILDVDRPAAPWQKRNVLSFHNLPGHYATDSEKLWGVWDCSHATLPDGSSFLVSARGNITRGVFLFRSESFLGPYEPVVPTTRGDGPIIQLPAPLTNAGQKPGQDTAVQSCDPFLFFHRGSGSLHVLSNNCPTSGAQRAAPGGGYVHSFAPGPDFTAWRLSNSSAACFTDSRSGCELAVSPSIALLGNRSFTPHSPRQSLTVLFDPLEPDVPLAVYTNNQGCTPTLGAVPIGDKGAAFLRS